MKKLVLIIAALFAGAGSSFAAGSVDKVAASNALRYGNSFIFIENGITFSVYPDGEFDFYLDNRSGVSAHVGVGPVGVTFNSGYDYNPYVQYDDYGAVIQVEDVPVYYDYYGRVNRIGNINIWYRNGMAYRIGGMHIYYGPGGYYDYHTGYINVYNRVYVYRPWHRYFVRPAVGFCMVYNRPYRRYYSPVRYTYYRPYVHNRRHAYARVGKSYRYQERVDRNRVYRNDSRVSVRSNAARSNDRIAYNRESSRVQRPVARTDRRGDSRGTQDIRRDQRPDTRAARTDRRPDARGTQSSRRSDPAQRAGTTVTRSSREVKSSPAGRTVKTSRTVTTRKPVERDVRGRQGQSNARKSSPAVTSRSTTVRRSAPSGRDQQVQKTTRSTTVKRQVVQPSRRSAAARSNSGSRSNRSGNE